MGILRLLLAVSVIAAHAGPLFGSTMLPGNFAVETFFMISGFYMSLVLSSKYSGSGAVTMFYSNRFCRLYPTYFVVLLGNWAWFFFVWWWTARLPANGWVREYSQMDLLSKLGLIVSNWTMIGNDLRCLFHFSPEQGFLFLHDYSTATAPDGAKWAGDFGTIGQAWSVGLEIWFYLLVPFLARLHNGMLLFVAVLSAATKLWMEMSGMLTYFFFPAQLFFFIIGMFGQRLTRHLIAKLASPKWGWGMTATLALFMIAFPYIDLAGKRWVFYSLAAVSLPFIFVASKSSNLDRCLGNLSYPIYMVHMLVMAVISAVLGKVDRALPTLAGTLLVSIALVIYLEDPLDKWRQSRVTRWFGPRT